MKTSSLLALMSLAALAPAKAIQSTNPLDTRDAPPAQPTTYSYGSLGPGVYSHHTDAAGKMYFVYVGNQTNSKTKRDNSVNYVNNYKSTRLCKNYKSNPIPQNPNKGPYGDWCEQPNRKNPWICNFHERTVDPLDLTSAYANMEDVLQGGYHITSKALSAVSNTAVAYICHFGDGIDYDRDHFAWMMGQLDTQCNSPAGGDYYDGRKYAVGRTSNIDSDNCAFRTD